MRSTTAPAAALALSLVGAASLAPVAGADEAAPTGAISGGAATRVQPVITRWSTTRSSFTAGRTPARLRVRVAGAAGGTVRAVVRVSSADGRRFLFAQDLGAVPANTTTDLRLRRTDRWRPGRYRLRFEARTADGSRARRRGAPTWRRVTVKASGRRSASSTPTVPAAPAPGAGGYVFPVQGACNFRSSQAQRFHAARGGGRRHNGQDIGTFTGYPPAVAITSAVVSSAFYDDAGGGWTLIMDGDDGYAWGYLHLKAGSLLVRPGQRVSAGQRVATVGDTGGNYDPHLHVEQRPRPWAANRDRAVDPMAILARLPNPCTG